jgi:hypothetical protein
MVPRQSGSEEASLPVTMEAASVAEAAGGTLMPPATVVPLLPPVAVAVFPVMVELVKVAAPPERSMPPPCPAAAQQREWVSTAFPLTVELIKVRTLPAPPLEIPPPCPWLVPPDAFESAVFPLTVEFSRIRVPVLVRPPPVEPGDCRPFDPFAVFPLIVESVIVTTPPPERTKSEPTSVAPFAIPPPNAMSPLPAPFPLTTEWSMVTVPPA